MAKSNNGATAETEPAVQSKRDKFASQVDVGIDPKPRLKRGVIFPRNKHPEGGFVISKEDAINAGWLEKNPVWSKHTLNSGVAIDALILLSMRVCVVSSTPNYAEGREEGNYLGIIDWQNYEHNRDLTKVCQNYLLLLLDENYQPLHKRAIHYKAHSNAGLSFTQAFVGSKARRGFYQEMDSCLRDYYEKESIPYDEGSVYKSHFNSVDRVEEPYHNCSVINLRFHGEKRGDENNVKKQSLCCLVQDWEHPTVDNFDQFWRDDLKPVIAEMLAEAEGWSRKILKNPQVMEILPYVDDNFGEMKSGWPPGFDENGNPVNPANPPY